MKIPFYEGSRVNIFYLQGKKNTNLLTKSIVIDPTIFKTQTIALGDKGPQWRQWGQGHNGIHIILRPDQ